MFSVRVGISRNVSYCSALQSKQGHRSRVPMPGRLSSVQRPSKPSVQKVVDLPKSRLHDHFRRTLRGSDASGVVIASVLRYTSWRMTL